MSSAKLALGLLLILFLGGCDLVSGPFGSTLYPPPPAGGSHAASATQSAPLSQSPVIGSQRTQYLWDKAMEGMAMGGALAGPYGAGGGLILGLLAGFFTADAHYAQINNQIQSEEAKDKELEAKIEQELQRQRELEAQIASSRPYPAQQNMPDPPQSTRTANGRKVTTIAMKDSSSTAVTASRKETFSRSSPGTFKNVEIKDVNGDGAPDLWIYYSPVKPGEVLRQEEATRWDGRVDTWSYFKDGKLVRREVDTQGKGTADRVYYFENDQIVREERDEKGTGYVSFRAIYENGRRAKVEEDTKGGGKTDHWIYYDTTKDDEIVLKEERDFDGDGAVDLWSYYENGRLVRRDLSAVGLQILSQREKLPMFLADPKKFPACK